MEIAARLISQLRIDLLPILINLIYRAITKRNRAAHVTSYPITREFRENVGESDKMITDGQVNFSRELLLNSKEKKTIEIAKIED
jgi:hypothetical protein